MVSRKRLVPRLLCTLLLAGSLPAAQAQSTDGYHAIQVFPVVVDSASFTQRFSFRSADAWEGYAVSVRYYPAQGTAQGAPLDCPDIAMPAVGGVEFASLRAMCPGLVAGSAFGTLVLRTTFGEIFAGHSRVSNPAGAGFSVDAFPANAFTTATSAVTGLRRRAATVSAPAFQSNCFVGNLGELAPTGAPATTDVMVELRNSADAVLGQTTVSVQPGQLVRLLDVFAAVGLPTGEYDNVAATFTAMVAEKPGLISFCTVQDNTSFGADFRIAKQELAWDNSAYGAQDGTAQRGIFGETELPIDGQVEGDPLAIPAGATRNVHVAYFRHPDVVSCGLLQPGGFSPATLGYGLEMRMRVQDDDGSWRTIAGGNNATSFNYVYLGDKKQQGFGANTRYLIEVESNGNNQAANRGYLLYCGSGSGSTGAELLRKGLPTAF